jgi:hypothetical protein
MITKDLGTPKQLACTIIIIFIFESTKVYLLRWCQCKTHNLLQGRCTKISRGQQPHCLHPLHTFLQIFNFILHHKQTINGSLLRFSDSSRISLESAPSNPSLPIHLSILARIQLHAPTQSRAEVECMSSRLVERPRR